MLATTEELIIAFQQGNMVVLVDDENRENEGDLVISASHADAAAINFMVTHARGLVCLALTEERCQHLQLPLMTLKNGTSFQTAFTVSIEAASGVTTGISAGDRARTIQTAVNPKSSANDLVSPGHVFPLKARKFGILERAGHTEASCDLATLAGLAPAAVICEIMNEDGSMARLPELLKFGEKHNLKVGTIKDMIDYRLEKEKIILRVQNRISNTTYGEILHIVYRCTINHALYDVLILGNIKSDSEAVVSIHQTHQITDYLELPINNCDLNIQGVFQYFLQSKPNFGCTVLIIRNYQNDLSNISIDKNMSKNQLSSYISNEIENAVFSQILIDLNIKQLAILNSDLLKLDNSKFQSIRSINL